MSDPTTQFIGTARLPWLRSISQALRIGAAVVGAATSYFAGFTQRDVAVLVALVAIVAWRTRTRPTSELQQRDELLLELVAVTVVIAATGGWYSPWLLALLVPLGLTVLSLSRGPGLIASAVVAVVTTAASGLSVLQNIPDITSRMGSLVLIVSFAMLARNVLLDTAGPQADVLGELGVLWSVRAMLEGLHSTAAGSRVLFSAEEAIEALRSSSPLLGRAEVLALLQLEDDGTLRVTHALGLPDEDFRVRDLPVQVGDPRRDGVPLVLDLPGGGVARDTRRGGYVWLPLEAEEVPHVLAVEFSTSEPPTEILSELSRIAQPLAVTVANSIWFGRVSHLGADEERQRIAARLHDQFAQSLVAVSMQLEQATHRYPDDDQLAGLRRHVKDTLGGLRDTMVELRARVDEERALSGVLDQLVQRLVDRHGVVAELTVEGDGPRPAPSVEQQLLRIAQELTRNAVEDRGASAVYVRYTVDESALRLEVTDDGDPPSARPTRPSIEIVRNRAEAIGARVATDDDRRGLTTVTVSLARRGDRVGERT